MNALPPPLLAPDVDLTDFAFIPLQIERLRKSKTWLVCRRRPELAFYHFNLWMRLWHERPAASIEDDDDVLADAAGCSPEKWPGVRVEVLRGWVKCSDGRLYHPVVAALAAEKWADKLLFRWKKECDRVRKENHARKEKGLELLPLPARPDQPMLASPSDAPRNSDGKSKPSDGIPAENALKGEGEGEGEEDLGLPVTDTETVTTSRQRAKSARAKSSRAERKSKLPEDWSLSDKLRAWTVDTLAATHAAGRVDIEHQFRKFKAHHLGKATMWVRWDQAWQTWIWNAIDWSDPNGKTRTHDAKPQRGSAGTRAAHGYAVYAAAGAGQLAKRRPPGDDDPA